MQQPNPLKKKGGGEESEIIDKRLSSSGPQEGGVAETLQGQGNG